MFECKICNYSSTNKAHYSKHLNTDKHKSKINKNNTSDTIKICNYCNKVFKFASNYYRHVKNKSCSNKNTNTTCDVIANNTNDNIIINKNNNNNNNNNNSQINNNQLNQLIDTVNNINKNVNFAIKSSSSLINYLMENYKDVEPVKKLTFDDCDKLIKTKYDNNKDNNKDNNNDNNKDKNNYNNNYDIQKDIIEKHKNKLLYEYISDLIVSIISNGDHTKQKIWNTDANRLNYAIKLRIDSWHNDINGFNFTILIIRPITDYISNLLQKYLEYLYDIQDEIIREKPQNKLKIEKNYYLIIETIEAYDYLKSNDIFKKILKSIAPKLRFHNININVNDQDDDDYNGDNIYNFDSDDDITIYTGTKRINKRMID